MLADRLKAVPTNIITGFLGVGKTTAILHLLKHKPQLERWAVLVNEFGEVGIDGGLITNASANPESLFIKEVPGGCMCCAAGLPMQIALNRLLKAARPQRLLIEPTGLGHPQEIIELLGSEFYRDTLEIRATLTLVDARKITDARYTDNRTFQQQLAVADVIVATKGDLCEVADIDALSNYLRQQHPDKIFRSVQHGQLTPDWLDLRSTTPQKPSTPTAPAVVMTVDLPETLPAEGYLRRDNRGEGFYSCGWRFSADYIFDYAGLFNLLTGIVAARLKGIFITDAGVFAFNRSSEVMTEMELDDALDSRLEIIDTAVIDGETIERALLASAVLID